MIYQKEMVVALKKLQVIVFLNYYLKNIPLRSLAAHRVAVGLGGHGSQLGGLSVKEGGGNSWFSDSFRSVCSSCSKGLFYIKNEDKHRIMALSNNLHTRTFNMTERECY